MYLCDTIFDIMHLLVNRLNIGIFTMSSGKKLHGEINDCVGTKYLSKIQNTKQRKT